MTDEEALQKSREALERATKECGTKTELARRIGVTLQAVSQWDRAPAGQVLKIEEATERKVTRHELRPDIFGPAPEEAAA